MSFDPKSDVPPMGHMEQKSSGKKWWMLGGCGCVVVLLLCGGGIGAIFFFVGKPTMDFLRENVELARNSQAIADVVGEPVELDEEPQVASQQQGNQATAEYVYRIKGPKAEGKLVINATFMQDSFTWRRDSMMLILDDGTEINVDPDAELELDIDMGEDESDAEESASEEADADATESDDAEASDEN